MCARWTTFCSLLILFAATLSAAEPARLPVPDAAHQRDAVKLLRTLFKDDYAKRRPDERAALPAKWLKYAYDTKDDSAAQYVLFCQARDQALDTGNLEVLLQAVQDLNRIFEIDGNTETAQVLAKVAAAVKSVDAARSLALVAQAIADDAFTAGQFDVGDRLLTAAEQAALKSRDVGTLTAVRQRKKTAQTERLEFTPVLAALKTLAAAPDDPAANTLVGRYECFTKGKWEQGIPRLLKGNDAELKDVAEKEQAASDSESQVKAANAWWAWAQTQAEPIKTAASGRAVNWYSMAQPTLAGLAKSVAEQRIKEFETAHPVPTKWVVLFRGNDPAAWNTDVSGLQYAISLEKAPQDLKYLRLKRMDTGDAIMMPLTRKDLGVSDLAANKPFRWNGSNSDVYGGRHLGIGQGERLGWLSNKGCIAISLQGNDPWVGSGFGHKHHGASDVKQCYSWKGQEIGKTVFEIAVTADEPTESEKKILVR